VLCAIFNAAESFSIRANSMTPQYFLFILISNHIGRIVICKDKSGTMPKLLRQFTAPIPKWLNHVFASFFLNQDALFLHNQERYLAKTGKYASYKTSEDDSADHYTKAVLPIETDKGKYGMYLTQSVE
jgi:hypothetical protein